MQDPPYNPETLMKGEVEGGRVFRQVQVVELRPEHSKVAAETLTRAFVDDPLWTLLLPDAETRAQNLRRLWGGVLRFSRTYGEIHTTPATQGVACWIAPGKTRMSLWQQARTGMTLPRALMSFPRDDRRRALAVLQLIDRSHRELAREPHWYLLVLGVAPESQRQGIGGSLLEPVLRKAGQRGLPCYLDTESEANVAFYAKRGFEVVHEGILPGSALRIWFMVRRPPRPPLL
jgi:ribosomal protein S18 acetylase RimI-like enzyme